MIVETTAGRIEGFERDGTLRFRGIPYATPPVGPLRFRPPQPVEPWSDVRPATQFGAMAPQGLGGLEAMLGSAQYAQDEDCLYLNVATPACDGAGRPVMVWIHGGAFVSGAGSIPWYQGTELVQRDDVVVVSINYRLGAFGFTHLGPALGEGYAGSGNCGLLDQIAALHWVRDNIAAFGGDPTNITVFGESAGGMSIGTLLGTPAADGLFHRAIAQSGACRMISSGDEASGVADELVAALGATDPEVLLTVDVPSLMTAQQQVSATRLVIDRETRGMSLLAFQPVVDGVVLPQHPLEAVRAGSAAGIDLITGTTLHEILLFTAFFQAEPVTTERLTERVARVVGPDSARDLIDAYTADDPDASLDDIWTALATDAVFRMPAIQLLEAQAAHRPDNVFGYLFTYESSAFGGKLRASHAMDVPFTFDVVDRAGTDMLVGPIRDDTRALARSMRQAWTTFARTGRPAADELPDWPAYTLDRRPTMELGSSRRVLDDPGAAARRAWAAVS